MFPYLIDDPNTQHVDGLENFGIMFLSGGLLLLVVPLIAYFMPETSGKELDEIQQLFLPQDRSSFRLVKESFNAFFNSTHVELILTDIKSTDDAAPTEMKMEEAGKVNNAFQN